MTNEELIAWAERTAAIAPAVAETIRGRAALEEEVARAQAAAAAAEADRDIALADAETARTDADSLRGQLTVAFARIAELESGQPSKVQRTFIGACPATSGTNADVVAKYGPGVAVRSFDGSGFAAPTRPEGTSFMHHSTKLGVTTLTTDEQIISMTKTLLPGDHVTINHEYPTKIRDGRAPADTAEAFVRQWNDFHERVVRLRTSGAIPKVYTNFVDAAWMWDTRSGLYPGTSTDPKSARYWGERIKADYIGPDLDAYAKTNGYPDFRPVIDNTIAFCKQYGFVDGAGNALWSAPEFVHFTVTSDPDGKLRADWFTMIFEYCFAKGADAPKSLLLFDTEWSSTRPKQPIVPGSPEFAAVKAAIAKAATLTT